MAREARHFVDEAVLETFPNSFIFGKYFQRVLQ